MPNWSHKSLEFQIELSKRLAASPASLSLSCYLSRDLAKILFHTVLLDAPLQEWHNRCKTFSSIVNSQGAALQASAMSCSSDKTPQREIFQWREKKFPKRKSSQPFSSSSSHSLLLTCSNVHYSAISLSACKGTQQRTIEQRCLPKRHQ